MATYAVLPDTLDIEFVGGDEVSILLDFDQNLTGYTFEAPIYLATSVRNGQVVEYELAMNFTQTPVDLAAGKLNLSLNETQTGLLVLGSVYRWYLRWVAPGIVTRTVLSGQVTPRSP